MSSSKYNNGKKSCEPKEFYKNDVLTTKQPPTLQTDNPPDDPDRAFIGQIQTNPDFHPTWLDDLWCDIEADLAGLIKRLELAYYQWQTSLNVGMNPAQSNAEWHSFISNFRSEISQLNIRVHDYNHQVPLPIFQKPAYVADSIITKLPDQAGR